MYFKTFSYFICIARSSWRHQRRSRLSNRMNNKIYLLRPFYTSFGGCCHQNSSFATTANCIPTEKLQMMMDKDPALAQMVRRIQKEFKIYECSAPRVPPTMFKDKHWIYLLKTTSVIERVRYFWFMGLNEGRVVNEREKKANSYNEHIAKRKEQAERIEAGGMGYGGGMYRLLENPLDNPLRQNTTFSLWNAIQLGMEMAGDDPPLKLLLDCQFLPQQKPHEYAKVSQNGAHAFYENYERRMPCSTSFINVRGDDPNTKNFVNKYIVPVGQNEWHSQLKISPNFHRNNPYHNPHERDPGKQVIYISKYADELLDGPLIHKAYVLPLTFDTKRETVRAAKTGGYRTMYLPIRKYIKWESGGLHVAFVTFQHIMNEVANNGGDWEYALNKFIPKHNRRTADENKERKGVVKHERVQEQREEKQRIADKITDALGHHQSRQFSKNKSFEAAILEYSNTQ